MDIEQSCGSCATSMKVNYSLRFSKGPSWSSSYRCHQCGNAIEVDADGPLGNPVRAKLLEKYGCVALIFGGSVSDMNLVKFIKSLAATDIKKAFSLARKIREQGGICGFSCEISWLKLCAENNGIVDFQVVDLIQCVDGKAYAFLDFFDDLGN
ncbi:hypothetical protein [Undibacterium umbellatum]|uniref:Uncharacterized protein n=1 Tax=Undibacterium umbellatum TaxID=2762300 RepID=A0ABR6Z9W2_9BURK|nr:hypothetical protein [Undibacterium umbellatum]MBC3907967.1 hypothetical protein [Undibacterium umbellatum]